MTAAWAQVFAWGCNSSGQLGVGDTAARRSPAAVEALWAMPVRSPLCAQNRHSGPCWQCFDISPVCLFGPPARHLWGRHQDATGHADAQTPALDLR